MRNIRITLTPSSMQKKLKKRHSSNLKPRRCTRWRKREVEEK